MATIRVKRSTLTSAPTGLTFGEPAFVDGINSFYVTKNDGTSLRVGAEVDSSTSLGTSNNKIPTQGAVKSYIDSQVAGGAVSTIEGLTGAIDLVAGTGIQITTAGQNITFTNVGVQSIAGTSNQISVSPAGGTGAVTLSLPSTVTVPGALNVTTDLTVTGNFTVNGTTTTVNSDVMTVDDPVIMLGLSGGLPLTVSDGGKSKGIAYSWYDTGSSTGKTGFFGIRNSSGSGQIFGLYESANLTSDTVGAGATLSTIESYALYLKANQNISVPGLHALASLSTSPSVAARTIYFADHAGYVMTPSTLGTSGYIIKANGPTAQPTWIDSNASGFTAFTSTNVLTASDTSDTSAVIAFVPAASATNQGIKYNSGLTYNAVTNSVSATTFVGAFSGNATTATTATNATNVATTVDTTDVQAFLAFVPLASDTNQGVRYNSGLTYNAVSNSLTATTFVGAFSGNATTASTLQTSRSIGLTGDVSGSASFNGSADINITATIAPNSVALGTDTTGNYVATLSTSSTGLSIANSGAESAAVTVNFATITSGLNMGTFSFATGEFSNSSGTVSLGTIDGGTFT